MDGETYRIYHLTPRKHIGLVMLPVGAYYNRELQQARQGDFIMFDDDENNKYRILRVAQLDLNSQIAALLAGYIYCSTLQSIFVRWRSTAVIQGYAKAAVSTNKCLVIEYDTLSYKVKSEENIVSYEGVTT